MNEIYRAALAFQVNPNFEKSAWIVSVNMMAKKNMNDIYRAVLAFHVNPNFEIAHC
jgi:hypothetical protein